MKHLSLFGNPIIETIKEGNINNMRNIVRYYDQDNEFQLTASNTEFYKDKIIEAEIDDWRIFNDYYRYYGYHRAYLELRKLYDFVPKK